jgi:integrase
MPRYLTAEQVKRLIAACDGETVARRRDRAIVLLLARLGLRAGDVAQLRLTDIQWDTGSLRVSGKSRYEVRLPLPQDVGDAIATYLECRPTTSEGDHVFLRTIAPCRPFRNGGGISSVVKRRMKRAGIVAPIKGAHALRHTAATEMLRHGVSLEKIGLALRAWLAIRGQVPAPEVFINARGEPMGLCLSAQAARRDRRSTATRPKRMSPHVLRHTCAMIGERVLAMSALVIVHELPWSELTNVHVGAACKMLSGDLGHRRSPGLRAPLRSRRTGLRATSRAVLFAFPTGRCVGPPVRTEWEVGFLPSDCGAS